jgi:hypothetical protein
MAVAIKPGGAGASAEAPADEFNMSRWQPAGIRKAVRDAIYGGSSGEVEKEQTTALH